MVSHTLSTQDLALTNVLADLRASVQAAWFVGSSQKEMSTIQQRSYAALGNSLHILDAYLVAKQFDQQLTFDIEPIVIGSVLSDVAHTLTPSARAFGCTIELVIKPMQRPVIANRQLLETALLALGGSCVTARAQQLEHEAGGSIVMTAHGRAGRVQFGMYTPLLGGVGLARLRKAADQNWSGLPLYAGSGVLVADMLVQRMSAQLRQSRFLKTPGFAASLPCSPQLSLVTV